MSSKKEVQDALDRRAGVTTEALKENGPGKSVRRDRLQRELYVRVGLEKPLKESKQEKEIREVKEKLEHIGAGLAQLKRDNQPDAPRKKENKELLESIGVTLDARVGIFKKPKGKDAQELIESLEKDLSERVDGAKDKLIILNESQAVDFSDTISLQESAALDSEDIVDVVIIEAGTNFEKKRHYPEKALQEAAPLFKGLKMFLDHASTDQRERPERKLKDWMATIIESHYADGKIFGRVAVHDSWLKQLLGDPVARKQLGISINAQGKTTSGKINGTDVQVIEAIDPISVDWVTEPGSGGHVAN